MKTTKTKILKNKKIKSESSKKWLLRHLNDPYVQKAQQDGYRSRAAYKILEINEKYHILKRGASILDLGSAPGGWSHAIAKRGGAGRMVAMDLLEMEPIQGVEFIQGDFLTEEMLNLLMTYPPFDLILSDMAPSTCGVASVDHLRITGLLEAILPLIDDLLNKGGHFVAKTFQGGTQVSLLNEFKKRFSKVSHMKPKSSRAASTEMYIVCLGKK
jgi:23S rRNA (uridine2552-2'-O)-methyltransferase